MSHDQDKPPSATPTRLQSCTCDQCHDIAIPDVSALVRHILYDHEPGCTVPFTCCETALSTRNSNWVHHFQQVHGCSQEPLPCVEPDCTATFGSLATLRRHKTRNHGEPVLCECHNKEFTGPQQLQDHLRKRKRREASHGVKDILPFQLWDGHESGGRDRAETGTAPAHPKWYNSTNGNIRQRLLSSAARFNIDKLGLLDLKGEATQDAIEPFLQLVEKWPPLTQVSTLYLDSDPSERKGSVPLHWPTEIHVPDPTKAIAQVMSDMRMQSKPTTYLSGEIDDATVFLEKETSPIDRVLAFMFVPQPDSPDLRYATNIPGHGVRANLIRVPGALHDWRHFDRDDTTKYGSNMTPQGVVVDMHRDSMDVFSVSSNWKIWVFFPPTPHNLALFHSDGKTSRRLFQHYKEYEDGHFAIAGPWQAIYIPSCYLHATYSLTSSITIGTVWYAAEGLEAVTDALIAELHSTAQLVVAWTSDLRPFLSCLVQAFYVRWYDACKKALQRVCWQQLSIGEHEGPLLGPGWRLKKSPPKDDKLIHKLVGEIGVGIAVS